MCGRYTNTQPEKIYERFKLPKHLSLEIKPNYNVAPTQTMPAIRADGNHDVIDLMQWGLVPPWSKDGKMSFSTINARAEGLEDKPTYRNSFRKRRCIIPADGFYEWKKTEDGKQPYYIRLKNHDLYGFAGLWEIWKNHDTGEEKHTYTIITTEANSLMKPIHDRMPVILEKQHEEPWLDPSIDDPHLLHSFLKPYKADEMEAFPVSKDVNIVKTNAAGLIEPIDSK